MINIVHNENYAKMELPPPPPYNSFVSKIAENSIEKTRSSNYFNNYPGPPPLTDDLMSMDQINPLAVKQENIISKKVRIYFLANGILTILCGLISIGIQIGFVALNLFTYYYYGFWGGIIFISIGLNTIGLFNHHNEFESLKVLHSFFWQNVLLSVICGIGIIIIILMNKCDHDPLCKLSYRILHEFLLGTFITVFLHSILNGIIFCILKRHHSFI